MRREERLGVDGQRSFDELTLLFVRVDDELKFSNHFLVCLYLSLYLLCLFEELNRLSMMLQRLWPLSSRGGAEGETSKTMGLANGEREGRGREKGREEMRETKQKEE